MVACRTSGCVRNSGTRSFLRSFPLVGFLPLAGPRADTTPRRFVSPEVSGFRPANRAAIRRRELNPPEKRVDKRFQ